jgi:hypothetical protein
MPFMYSAVSSGPLLRKLHASISERTGRAISSPSSTCTKRMLTLQSVNGPCFKLVERNLGRGWEDVEVEAVLIVLLLEFGLCKLLALVVEIGASLGINS